VLEEGKSIEDKKSNYTNKNDDTGGPAGASKLSLLTSLTNDSLRICIVCSDPLKKKCPNTSDTGAGTDTRARAGTKEGDIKGETVTETGYKEEWEICTSPPEQEPSSAVASEKIANTFGEPWMAKRER
jgi:hypothetical protein